MDEIGDLNDKRQWSPIKNLKVEQEEKTTTTSQFFKNGLAKTKKIKMKSGLELECTLNHQYRILNSDNEYVWCRADELKINDKIVYKLGTFSTKHPNTLSSDIAKFICLYMFFQLDWELEPTDKLRIVIDTEEVDINMVLSVINNITNKYTIMEDPYANGNKHTQMIIVKDGKLIADLTTMGFFRWLKKMYSSMFTKPELGTYIPKIIRQSSKKVIKDYVLFMKEIMKTLNKKYEEHDEYTISRFNDLITTLRFIGIDSCYDTETRGIIIKESTPCKKLKKYGTLYTDEIVSITDSENETYDIEVPNTNTYLANSYVSHNTISLLCDVSSGVEPNFAYMWDRKVSITDNTGKNKIETRKYVHKLVPKEYLEELEKTGKISNPLFKNAMEIDPKDHLGIVSIFSNYIDCSISKTISLPSTATVEDVKKIYDSCYESGIKGITIYRDGSRETQPINITTKKEEPTTKSSKNVDDSEIRRPLTGIGAFTQVKSPYGTLHVSAKFNNKDEMREVFITLNKSGQELKAVTEGIARLISIALQEAEDYKSTYRRIVKTLKGIAGFEIFVYDGILTGQEHVVKSICDVLPYILPDLEYTHLLNKYGSREEAINRMIAKVNIPIEDDDPNINDYIERYNKNKTLVCPECGGTSFYKSDGCDIDETSILSIAEISTQTTVIILCNIF